MGSFGHSVRAIEHSHHRVVIEETATTGAVWLFGGAALIALSLWVAKPRPHGSTFAQEAVGACAVLFFASIALYASVRSTYTADRPTRQLVIERRILGWTLRTAYDAHMIDHVYVRETPRGSGLYIRFKSGSRKRLSQSMDFFQLEAFGVALNTALDTHGH
jgi:hypothetical protein